MKKPVITQLLNEYNATIDLLVQAVGQDNPLLTRVLEIRAALEREINDKKTRNRKPRFTYDYLKQQLNENKIIYQIAYENKVCVRTVEKYLKRYKLEEFRHK